MNCCGFFFAVRGPLSGAASSVPYFPQFVICGKLQVLEHQHGDRCFTEEDAAADSDALTCTDTDADHVHSERCYGTWVLTCGREEHTHTGACFSSGKSGSPAVVMASGDTEQPAAGTLNVSLL